MSTETNEQEVYENGQQREEEALAVITENNDSTETPTAQVGSDQTEGTGAAAAAAAENESKENDEHHDHQGQQQKQEQSQKQNSEAGGNDDKSDDKPKEQGPEGERQDQDKDKPKLAEGEKSPESDIKAENTISVGTSTVLVETQEVVTSSTNQHQQRKHSTGRIRAAGRRASYQSSRSYAGGSFQNYGLTYLPYKSNFEPSEDSRRRADEFFKTLKL